MIQDARCPAKLQKKVARNSKDDMSKGCGSDFINAIIDLLTSVVIYCWMHVEYLTMRYAV